MALTLFFLLIFDLQPAHQQANLAQARARNAVMDGSLVEPLGKRCANSNLSENKFSKGGFMVSYDLFCGFMVS